MSNRFLSIFGLKGEDAEVAPQLQAVTPDEITAGVPVLQAEIEKLKRDRNWAEDRYREDILAYKGVIDNQATEIKALKAQAADLAQKLEDSENSAREKAIQMLSKVGHEPIDVSGTAGRDTQSHNEEIVAQYKEMPQGKERAEFRKKHDKILKEAFGPGRLFI